MKNLIILLLGVLMAEVYAQDTFTVDAKKISQTETPVTIVEAISTDFPDSEATAYYVLNAENIQSDWVITEEDNLKPGEKIDHYSVVLKGKKGGYVHAFYNGKGELMMTKVIANDFILPTAIQSAATSRKYKGYAIKSDKYVLVKNSKKNKEYMEVTVAKGSETKKLYFTKDAKLIKEK